MTTHMKQPAPLGATAAFVLATATAVASMLTPTAASAQELQCTTVGSAKVRCHFDPVEILPAQDFHAEVKINYAFDCSGHAIDLAFVSDESSVPVRFRADGGPVTLKGKGPFRIVDTDRDRTYRATLVGPCKIESVTSDVWPSQQTLEIWKGEAKAAAVKLDALLTELRLSKTLKSVVDWDDEQLHATATRLDEILRQRLPPELPYESLIYPQDYPDAAKHGQLKDAADMLEGWTMAVVMNPDLPDTVALKAQIESVMTGRPAYDARDIERIKQEITTAATAGQAIVDRTTVWIAKADAELKALAEKLKSKINQTHSA